MSATAALATIHAAGITLTVDGDQLIATPAHLLTGELRTLARAYKHLLMDLVRAETAKPCPTPHDRQTAEQWLDQIGETDPEARCEFLERIQANART